MQNNNKKGVNIIYNFDNTTFFKTYKAVSVKFISHGYGRAFFKLFYLE